MSRSVREWGTQPSTPCPSWGTYSRASRRPPPQARDIAYLSPPPSCWPSSWCGKRNLTGGMPRCCGLQRAFNCFCGFLHSGEATCPSETEFDPGSHLAFSDVAADSRDTTTALQVTIKASKTDPFQQGVTLHIGVSSGPLCPVAAVLSYMVARGSSAGPLFHWVDGKFLTRARFVESTRTALTQAGYRAKDYVGHSFRIGAATTAAQRGIQDSLIKTLGRWESSTRYIRMPPPVLQGVAKVYARTLVDYWIVLICLLLMAS